MAQATLEHPRADSPGTSLSSSSAAQPTRTGMVGAAEYIINPVVVVLITLVGIKLGGAWLLLPPLFVFGFIPALDHLVGTDTFNPSEEMLARLADERKYRYITYAWVPMQGAILAWALWRVSIGSYSVGELIGISIAVGILTGGIGITFAHELCHKTNKLEQHLGKALLMMVCYMHFHIEHNLGHHVNVSTPKDPATSRFGESFYRFYPRTVFGSIASAWRLETRRLQKARLAVWSPHNLMIWAAALPLLLAAIIGGSLGPTALAVFLGQALMAFSLLELVNYIEHYGLERRALAPGRYERVSPLHSWNSNHRVTNGFLIMLQRHSDHHANAQRRYQTLRHFDESPQLPTGYAGMILLALLPPVWYRVMNPRVLEYRMRLDALRQRESASDGENRAGSTSPPRMDLDDQRESASDGEHRAGSTSPPRMDLDDQRESASDGENRAGAPA